MPEYLRISCQMSLHIAAVAFNSLFFGGGGCTRLGHVLRKLKFPIYYY